MSRCTWVRLLAGGRGPENNFRDRQDGYFMGEYSSKVADQFVPFPKPQSMGNREDVRWAALTDRCHFSRCGKVGGLGHGPYHESHAVLAGSHLIGFERSALTAAGAVSRCVAAASGLCARRTRRIRHIHLLRTRP